MNGPLGIFLWGARDVLTLGYCGVVPLTLLYPATNDMGRRR